MATNAMVPTCNDVVEMAMSNPCSNGVKTLVKTDPDVTLHTESLHKQGINKSIDSLYTRGNILTSLQDFFHKAILNVKRYQGADLPGVRSPVSGSLRVKLTRSWRKPRGRLAAMK